MSAERRYRRLLRWYPEDWRHEHGDVVLGMLLDDADAEGRDGPDASEALRLVVDGIAHRAWRRVDRRRTTATAFVVAAVLALLYVVLGTWSTGTASVGFLGPFSNPTVLVAVALAVAAGLALLGRTAAARLLALAAVAGLVLLVVVAERSGWMGPGALVLAILAPPALSGAIPPTGARGAARDAIAAVVLVAVVLGGGIVASWSELLIDVLAPGGALLLGASPSDVELAVLVVAGPLVALAARRPIRGRRKPAAIRGAVT
ncbi:hypothetical protein [Rathayibacter sp. SD072]|uniref:hypothetical protein n=1 Tax=Rathayibacter sp. SD072 TaxID=2781731 RepID=UPI001A97A867|nr:hypothetical protein [Rathayibacter sp. SD072]MBO0984225.1 hypothetical protein [Rathayibacter sp. SD072]